MIPHHNLFNYHFSTKLDSWTPLKMPLHHYFTDHEIEQLDRSDRAFQHAGRTVAILSFENNLVPLGGLAAVIRHLPSALVKQNERIVVVTPLHSACNAVKEALDNGVLANCFTEMPVRVCGYSGSVSCYQETSATTTTFHIGIDGRFTAGDNPYGYSDNERLLMDALSFCAVVPSVLSKLMISENLLFHAHDWETALIALFARYAILSGVLQSAKTVLTLHNSFDAPLPDHLKQLFFNKPIEGQTVLQTMLPFVNGPLTTVSAPFAFELRNDPLQCGVFVDHLQTLFARNPPLGIENGMFGKPVIPFDKNELAAADAGDTTFLLAKKSVWRTFFLTELQKETDTRIIGRLTGASLDNPLLPVFFMSGRLDLMQKGFDVIFHAIKMLKPGTVQLFFCPTLRSESDDLSFFKNCEEACRGDIVIWPFHISSERYRSFLLGSSFLLMPSLYEPFGSASEGFLNGTPLIARATGGLLSQIHPGNDTALPSGYTDCFPPDLSYSANGILFKEDFPLEKTKNAWKILLQTPPDQRLKLELYRAIVDAALNALKKATHLFVQQQSYGIMIMQGLHSVQGHTWDIAVKKYRAVYDVAQTRG